MTLMLTQALLRQHLFDAAAVVRFLLFKEPAFVDKTYSTAAWAGNKTAYS